MIFFEPTIARSGPTTERVITLDFSGSMAWDYLFIKWASTPVDFTIDGIRAGFSPQALTTVTDVYGNTLSKASDGFLNDHYDLVKEGFSAQTGTQFAIRLSAAASIHQILVLKKVVDYTGKEWNSRAWIDNVEDVPLGVLRPTATKRLRYIPPLNQTPDAWRVPVQIIFDRQHEADYNTFNAFKRQYKGGFVFAADPVFHPEVIGDAIFEGSRQVDYPSRWKRAGRRFRGTVRSL